MDDVIFDDINLSQWAWYAQMIIQDKKKSDEKDIHMVEYLASFWNAEAVNKIRQARELESDDKFMDDNEFEKAVREEIWKDDSIIETIKNKYKNTNLDDNNDRHRKGARDIRLPTEKLLISNIIKK